MTKVFINEIHYENIGRDVEEGIEIAGPAGTNLEGWGLYLYLFILFKSYIFEFGSLFQYCIDFYIYLMDVANLSIIFQYLSSTHRGS